MTIGVAGSIAACKKGMHTWTAWVIDGFRHCYHCSAKRRL